MAMQFLSFSHPANNRIADELHQRLKAFVKDETQKIEDSVDNGEMEREEADTLIDNFNNFMDTVEDTLPHVFGEFFSGIADDWTDDFIVTNRCDSYLGNPEESGSPAYYLQFVFNIMKYASIVMLFVFTISEYVKAIVSNNQDAIKKATIKAIKILIIAVIIFFLPILIKFLLTILGAYDPGTCNIN